MERTTTDKKCWKNIRTVAETLDTDNESAYAMILLTAVLMDYAPWDKQVVDAILKDHGCEDMVTA